MSSRKGSRRPPHRPPFDAGRRRFLAGMAAATGALALPGCGAGPESQEKARDAVGRLPNPADSGIDHIVQVMMENRSYDHFLGWVPGSDGIQQQTFRHNDRRKVDTFRMGDAAPDYGWQGCGWEDPAHGYNDGRRHLNDGAMDGFLKTVNNDADVFPVGYYDADDLPFYKGVAEHFTICDQYFHGILASTFPNRIYMHAGQTDRLNNAFYPGQDDGEPPTPSALPTIWDRLKAKGLTGRNYFSDAPITAFWGDKYADISRPFEEFLADAARGTLPSVAYFDPYFGGAGLGESPAGISKDDHPQADVRDGQVYLTEIYDALRKSPNWERTLMIVTYDEWGGFFDHVAPPTGPITAEEAALGNDGLLGFRTPCVILGPRAKRGHVSNLRFDPNSVLNLITWRFGLEPLPVPRSQWSHNMALALDFKNPPNPDAPAFGQLSPGGLPASHRAPGYGAPCFNAVTNQTPLAELAPAQRQWLEHQNELRPLFDLAKRHRLI